MAGLTATGFTIKTQSEIFDEIMSAIRSAFGASVGGETITEFVGIFSEREALLWELAEAVYNSDDPDAAVDAALEAICALTGTKRDKAKPSTVTLTLTGDPSTDVSAGSRASVDSTEDEFATDEDATIAELDDWESSTAYSVGDRVTNGEDAWECTVAGTSAGSGGPDSAGLDQGDTVADGGVTWLFLGEGEAAVDVESSSVENGPIEASAHDITTIETPVSGWKSVINTLDATKGQNKEPNADLRVKREQELARAGTGPKDAIRADLLDVEGVTAAKVFVNDDDVTDADGVPPHSVEALVQGGEDQDIWDQLFASVGGGIRTHGDESGTVTDSEGNSITVKFSRPTTKDVYIDITLTKDPDTYEGDAEVKAAIVEYGDAQKVGKDVVASAISAAAFGVDGVLDVTATLIDTSSDPSGSATIDISNRELALYDTSRITVNSSDGTP